MDFANLVSTEDALHSLSEQSRLLLEGAQATCEQMFSEAETRVAELVAAAEVIKREAASEGLRIGRNEATDVWTKRSVDQAKESRDMMERQKLRLRDIVSLCVERLIGETDRKALFARALKTIGKLVHEVPLLTLRVHESDLDAARAAVDELLLQAGPGCTIDVTADSGLEPGACLFESDLGVIDAGLAHQLQSVRRAVARATEHTDASV